jgi:HEAT repeat protein
MPVVEKTLEDENESVIAIALSYFTDTENEDGRLNRISKPDKARLLPKFIRCMNSGDRSVRNNAIGALYYYPEAKEKVVPVLTRALADSHPRVQIRAAEALNRVAPDQMKSSGAMPVIVQVLKNPDDQISYRAAVLLGQCGQQSDVVVPALIEALQSTNTLVASKAVWAICNFTNESAVILPALRRAAQRKDNAAVDARSAVNQFERIEAKRNL